MACNIIPTRKRPVHTELHTTVSYPVTVQTFLRPEDAIDDDKWILQHDDRYLRMNNDAFRVFSSSQYKSAEPPSQVKLMVELPDLTEDELPHNEIRSAERVLNSYCDEKR